MDGKHSTRTLIAVAIGSAIGGFVACGLLAAAIAVYLFRVSFDPEREPQQRISAPPTIESARGFLGTHSFVHGQQPNRGQQLASGPGVLTG